MLYPVCVFILWIVVSLSAFAVVFRHYCLFISLDYPKCVLSLIIVFPPYFTCIVEREWIIILLFMGKGIIAEIYFEIIMESWKR